MHGPGKSDPPIVPGKRPNKPGRPGAEAVEGRGGAKGTAGRQSTGRTQSRETVSQALACVREAAKRNRNERFTSLMHHVTPELLAWAFHQLKARAAPGVDGVTWEEYAGALDGNIDDLHRRVMRGGYRAKPSRRQYIPKADGRQRPLGIAALEDKIVQRALVEVLNAIYETDFLGFSYGFRPGRSQHDALDALAFGITRRPVNWVLDADIRAFFDSISHDWMMRFLEHRIGDRRVLRLIAKWLKAGVMEEGALTESTEGTPQGAVISPLLANIYLHYVYDLWADQWRKREATGEVIVVRYADDTIVGFERQADAERFLRDLRERLAKFGLALHPDKTRLIEFGRYAAQRRSAPGPGETGDVRFPRLHAHLREGEGRRMVHSGAAHHRQADASQTRRDQGGAEPHAPRAGARTGALAGAGGARLSRVPRRADQFAEDHVLPLSRRVALATRALAPKPEGPRHVGADGADRRALAATRQDQPSLAAIPLPRQTPEVGAECVSSARSDLSGGRRVKPASLPGCPVSH